MRVWVTGGRFRRFGLVCFNSYNHDIWFSASNQSPRTAYGYPLCQLSSTAAIRSATAAFKELITKSLHHVEKVETLPGKAPPWYDHPLSNLLRLLSPRKLFAALEHRSARVFLLVQLDSDDGLRVYRDFVTTSANAVPHQLHQKLRRLVRHAPAPLFEDSDLHGSLQSQHQRGSQGDQGAIDLEEARDVHELAHLLLIDRRWREKLWRIRWDDLVPTDALVHLIRLSFVAMQVLQARPEVQVPDIHTSVGLQGL